MKLALIALLSISSFAQESPDLSVIEELQDRKEKALEDIVEPRKNELDKFEKFALKVQVGDIIDSGTYRGHISKGAKLVKLSTDEQQELPEDIYVRAYSLPDKQGYVYLEGKKGEPIYKTMGHNVTNVEQVLKMKEPPPYWQPVVRKKPKDVDEHSFPIYTELALHLGLSSPKFTKDLVNDDTNNPGVAVRYEVQAYSPFSMPFSVGLNLMAETTNGNLGSQSESYAGSALSIGPIFKSKEFQFLDYTLMATIGARTSIFARIKETRPEGEASYRLNQTTLFFGLQRNINLKFGELTIGANFQRQWAKAKSEGVESDISGTARYDDTVSLSLGHRMDWL